MTETTVRTTRAQRMAMPLAREVVKDLAVEHGACIRPIQLRRTNLDTGEADTVLVPCGHTLAHVCPSCAERARTLRAAQCREGWHLEDEPAIEPDPATDDQKWWIEKRSEAQQLRDAADAAGTDTTDLDELLAELDEEITKAGMRGKAAPDRPARRHRSTRRRQDAPDLPRRKVSPRTVGKTYTAPDGKTFRPSLFVTLTCPSYGRVSEDGTPADPAAYDYDRAARDALTFAALFDRFIQNLRRYLGYDVQYFAAIEPQRRLAPHVHLAIRGTVARDRAAPGSGRYLSPGLVAERRARSSTTRTSCPSGTRRPAATWTRLPGRCCRPGTRRSTPSARRMQPWHVARFGVRFDAQGVLAGSKDAARCIGYLTKYLTKQVGDCHQADTDTQRAHAARLAEALRYPAVLAAVRELAPLRHPAQERPARPGPRPVQGQSPRRRPPRLRRAAGPGLAQVVRQDAGRPPRRPQGLAAADPRCFGNRPGPVRLGTGCPVRPGLPGPCAAAAACRRRPCTLASRTQRGQAPSGYAPGQ